MKLARISHNHLAAAFALWFTAGCLDWDKLRVREDAMVAPDGGSPTLDNERDLLVEWDFTQFANDVVPDLATREPDVPLFLAPNVGGETPIVDGKGLLLRRNILESKPTAARALSDATAAAGGGFTVEFWLRDTSIQEGEVFGLASDGFIASFRNEALWVDFVTSLGTIDLEYPADALLVGTWHQMAFTYRPGLALLTGYFDGKSVALAGNAVADATSRIAFFTAATEATGSVFVSDTELGGRRLAFAAIFARELSADEMKRRYTIGLSRF